MRVALVLGVVGHFVRLFSLAFLPPLILALHDGESALHSGRFDAAEHFAVTLVACAALGWLLGRWFPREPLLHRAEALAIVAATWLVVGAVGSFPYLFAGLSGVDAVFESISGLTTTGATILTDFGAHGRAFFLWRAMSQWFGGLGVIALFVVVLPRLGIAGRQLFFAEASISTGEGISPQIRGAARKLWALYVGLTLLLVVLLVGVGFRPYDAVVHSLTTLSAGGFSPDPASIQGYANARAEWILVVFMILAGTSFPLQWRALAGRPFELFRDGEFLAYILVMVIAAVLVAGLVAGGLPGAGDLRAGAFQVASLTSSTGYASVDFEAAWSAGAKAVLIAVMVIGGCAGSACGGPKVVRYLLMLGFLRREMKQVLHPNAVIPLRYRKRSIQPAVMRAVVTLVMLFLAGYLGVGLLVVVVDPGVDLTTGLSASLACFGNIGPAFGFAGPMGSYAPFSDPAKILLTLSMWLGRLEIVTVLALLHPDVWRHLSWRGKRPRAA